MRQELVLSIKDLTLSLRSAVPPVPYLHFKLVFRPRAVLVDWLEEQGLYCRVRNRAQIKEKDKRLETRQRF